MVYCNVVVMDTIQIRLTKEQIKKLDEMIKIGEYPNRSEAVRDAVRKLENNGN